MRVTTTLRHFIDPPAPPTPAAPSPFDDGLVEIARLIAVEDPVLDATLHASGLPDR